MPKSDKIVVVFHADGCHFCHQYLPRFRRVAGKYKGQVAIKSANLSRAENAKVADRYKIEGVPATCILDGSEKLLHKEEGDLDEKGIEALFKKAVGG